MPSDHSHEIIYTRLCMTYLTGKGALYSVVPRCSPQQHHCSRHSIHHPNPAQIMVQPRQACATTSRSGAGRRKCRLHTRRSLMLPPVLDRAFSPCGSPCGSLPHCSNSPGNSSTSHGFPGGKYFACSPLCKIRHVSTVCILTSVLTGRGVYM
jgi:hypothetical protein